MNELLKIENLSVSIETDMGTVQAVRDVSFELHPGEVLAIVGESGSGKSILCKSIMKLLPKNAKIECGKIIANGEDITNFPECRMQKLRGKVFSFILQDSMTVLNPTVCIGKQIAEAVSVHNPKLCKKDLHDRVISLMEMVGIQHPCERYRLYPHNLSGGMRQRCVMAIALASGPRILLADEPTTSLDVTMQAKILDILREMQGKPVMGTVLVSHDLGAVARVADRVAVMYAGRIVEIGTAEEIYYQSRHPYTWALMQSLPAFNSGNDELKTIPGIPPDLANLPKGDAFASRNEYALEIDYHEMPPMFRLSETHFVASWLEDPRAPKTDAPMGGAKNV